MQTTIQTPAELGLVLRAVRRQAGVRLDDLAATAGVSKQFVSDLEYGKPTVQLGLVLKVLAELGLPLALDVPPQAAPAVDALRAAGGVRRRRA